MPIHSSEKIGLCLMKCSCEMLQNLPYFIFLYMYENTKLLFLLFILCYFIFSLINTIVYADIDQGIHWGKIKVAWNEKKQLLFFVYIRYGKWSYLSSIILFFLKSAKISSSFLGGCPQRRSRKDLTVSILFWSDYKTE